MLPAASIWRPSTVGFALTEAGNPARRDRRDRRGDQHRGHDPIDELADIEPSMRSGFTSTGLWAASAMCAGALRRLRGRGAGRLRNRRPAQMAGDPRWLWHHVRSGPRPPPSRLHPGSGALPRDVLAGPKQGHSSTIRAHIGTTRVSSSARPRGVSGSGRRFARSASKGCARGSDATLASPGISGARGGARAIGAPAATRAVDLLFPISAGEHVGAGDR